MCVSFAIARGTMLKTKHKDAGGGLQRSCGILVGVVWSTIPIRKKKKLPHSRRTTNIIVILLRPHATRRGFNLFYSPAATVRHNHGHRPWGATGCASVGSNLESSGRFSAVAHHDGAMRFHCKQWSYGVFWNIFLAESIHSCHQEGSKHKQSSITIQKAWTARFEKPKFVETFWRLWGCAIVSMLYFGCSPFVRR